MAGIKSFSEVSRVCGIEAELGQAKVSDTTYV